MSTIRTYVRTVIVDRKYNTARHAWPAAQTETRLDMPSPIKPHPFMPNSVPAIKQSLLDALGVTSTAELFAQIPEEHRLTTPLELPAGLTSEAALGRHLRGLLQFDPPPRNAKPRPGSDFSGQDPGHGGQSGGSSVDICGVAGLPSAMSMIWGHYLFFMQWHISSPLSCLLQRIQGA